MAETIGQRLDRIIADLNEELALAGNEAQIPNRYGMEYCATVATRLVLEVNPQLTETKPTDAKEQ